MKLESQIAIMLLVVFNNVSAPFLGQELIQVDEKDAHWGIVQSEIERITKSDSNSITGNKIDFFGLINTKDANSLFKGWKFYYFEYSMYAKNPADKNNISMAMGLGNTLAVFSNSNPVKTFRFYKYGNYEEYGDYLTVNKIVIRDTNDAKLVWDAFCEIHRMGWKNYKLEKVSDNEWKLGINSYEQKIASNTIVKRTHFTKVTIDPNTKQITGWKSTVETSDKRFEKNVLINLIQEKIHFLFKD